MPKGLEPPFCILKFKKCIYLINPIKIILKKNTNQPSQN